MLIKLPPVITAVNIKYRQNCPQQNVHFLSQKEMNHTIRGLKKYKPEGTHRLDTVSLARTSDRSETVNFIVFHYSTAGYICCFTHDLNSVSEIPFKHKLINIS